MKVQPWIQPGEPVTHLGSAFGTPLVAKGLTWLPLVQLAAWGLMAWISGRRHPSWPIQRRLGVGAASAAIALGSEWGHNLAHVAAARAVGKPADAIRVAWGLPMLVYHNTSDTSVSPRQHLLRGLGGPLLRWSLVYHNTSDTSVSPRQHLLRGLGGPLFNLLLVPLARLLRRFTAPGSAARDLADDAYRTNLFLVSSSFTPLPFLDGGPLLRWSLVAGGRSLEQADAAVRSVNRLAGIGFSLSGAAALSRRRWLLASLLSQYAAWCFAFGFGWLKEP